MLLGDETFGGGIFPYLYEEVGGWVFSPKQLPQVQIPVIVNTKSGRS